MSSLSIIPCELLLPICSYLSHSDLDSFKGINRRFNHFITKNGRLLYNRMIDIDIFKFTRTNKRQHDKIVFATTAKLQLKTIFSQNICIWSNFNEFFVGLDIDEVCHRIISLYREIHVTLSRILDKNTLQSIIPILNKSNSLTMSCDIDKSLTRNDIYQHLFKPRRDFVLGRFINSPFSLFDEEFLKVAGSGRLEIDRYMRIEDKQFEKLVLREDLDHIYIKLITGLSQKQLRKTIQDLLTSSTEIEVDFFMDLPFVIDEFNGDLFTSIKDEEEMVTLAYERHLREKQRAFSISDYTHVLKYSTQKRTVHFQLIFYREGFDVYLRAKNV